MSLTILSVAYPLAPVSLDSAGGAEQVLAHLDRALVTRGFRSVVIAREGSRVAGTLVPLPAPTAPLDDNTRRQVRRETRQIIEAALANYDVDVVHMHGIDFHEYLPSTGIPLLATLHLPPEWYPPEVFHPSRPETYLNCVSNSQHQRCPSSPNLLEPIPNGVDSAIFTAVCEKADYALALGRVCLEKGFHLALEATEMAGVRLILAGELYPYPEHLRYFEEFIKPSLDGDMRVWIGPAGLDRKRELLARARCVLLPSLVRETSSLVAMEALASATPVIAYPLGALPDIVEHGVTGFLVNNVTEMANAIHDASAIDPQTCRSRAEERFSVDQTLDGYLRTYAAIAHRRSSAGLRVEVVTDPARLHALQQEWALLFNASADAAPFLHPAWQLHWWDLFGGCPLHAIALWSGTHLEALAPLYVYDGRLAFIGNGISDRLDILARTSAAAERLVREIDAAPFGLDLQEVAAASPLLRLPHEPCSTSPCLDLSRPVPAKMRKNLRRALRDLHRAGTVEFVRGTIEDLFTLHELRWRGEGVLSDTLIREFHRRVARAFDAAGILRLWTLRLDGGPIAVFYGFAHGRTTSYYLGGFDPAFDCFSAGSLVIAHALEQSRAENHRYFDFLRGAEPYKLRWGAEPRAQHRVARKIPLCSQVHP